MKVLYSTMSVVEYDGSHYYNNPIKATYPRYLPLGDDITVICFLKNTKQAKQDLIEDGVLKFRFVRKTNSLKSLLGEDRLYNKRLIEEEVKKADVCVLHMPCFHNNTVIKYAKKYGKPYMTVVCGCAFDEYWTYDWRGKLVAPFAYYAFKNVQRKAPFSIYVTNSFLQKRYPTEGRSIGCSNVNINTGLSGVVEQRVSSIRERSHKCERLKIGTAAAVDVPYKGQKDIVKAISILHSEGIDFEYHLVGRGDPSGLKRFSVEQGVGDLVIIHSAIPHEKVLEFYDSIDIYAQPSRTEGLPRALIEAMSRGCLCIGSNVGGIPELLAPEFLFPKGNSKRIAMILRRINKDELEKQAVRNYEKAKDYDVRVLNERRATFIEDFAKTIKG